MQQYTRKIVRTAWFFGLLGITALGWFALVTVPERVIWSARNEVVRTPAEVDLAFQDVTISASDADLTLAGWWMPAEGASATLVFIHGGSSNRHSAYFQALEFYRAIVEQGVSVLAIDLRNHGASGGDERGIQFGLSESADAIAALDWARQQAPGLPVFAMGISMGGATLIHAASRGAEVEGLVLLDPLLDTRSAFTRAVWAESGIPPAVLVPSAWAAVRFYGLPGPGRQALDVAAGLKVPTLLIQDPQDPVTIAQFARELAARNATVSLWMVPEVDPQQVDLAWKHRWGSHVAAFSLYPELTVDRILRFMAER